jgi:hypothetical protein
MEASFQNRHLLTESGRHPQIISLKKGNVAMVCEESLESPVASSKTKDHKMSGMAMNHTAAGSAKIVLRLLDNKARQGKKVDITDGQYADHHAVIDEIFNNLLIAWVRQENGHSSIYYAIKRND